VPAFGVVGQRSATPIRTLPCDPINSVILSASGRGLLSGQTLAITLHSTWL
jgi:hypothetical protein